MSLYASNVPDTDGSHNYDEYYDTAALAVPDFVNSRVAEIVSGFNSFRNSGRLLDIGFGAGSIMDAARTQGWDVSGTEVSKGAIDYAVSRGFDVHYGELADARFSNGEFDVITASEILEHLSDPVETLKEIARILRPGGLFWATTPSATGLSFRVLKLKWTVLAPPEHLQLYSRRGAHSLLREAGFADPTFDRVESDHRLNQSLTKSPVRKALKTVLNNALSASRLGDSMKIFAVNSSVGR